MISRRRSAPSLVLWAAACIGLLFGAIALAVLVGGVMPLPYGPAAPIQQYVADQSVAVRVIAVGAFASSVPLAIYAATACAQLRQLGVTGAAPTIALSGGILAAGALSLTGLVGWIFSQPDISANRALVRALYYLAFLTGGPAHIVALGLLVIGMSVPGLTMRLLPRTQAWAGVVTGVFAELTTLVLIWTALGVMLPVARVAALVWLLVAGGLLPVRRNEIRVAG